MWVQEGSDCKDTEDSVTSNSLFARLYSSRKTDSVTIIGIPMKRPQSISQTSTQQNNLNKLIDDEPVTRQQTVHQLSTMTESSQLPSSSSLSDDSRMDLTANGISGGRTPISPAQFLENMNMSKKTKATSILNDDDDDLDVGDTKTCDDISLCAVDDPVMDILRDNINDYGMMDVDQDDDGANFSEHDQVADDDVNDMDQKFCDLQIVGTKIPLHFINDMNDMNDNNYDDDENDENDVEINQDYLHAKYYEDEQQQTKNRKIMEFDDKSNDMMHGRNQFDGLDIRRWSEWDQCLAFTKNNGLLVVELYSTEFGPSDVMYSFIEEILHKKQNNQIPIRFVRLNLVQCDYIDEIKEVITDFAKYKYQSTPIPMYVFIKNGIKMDQLNGTELKQFERLIDKYTKSEPQQQTADSINYKSIFAERPQSAYLSSNIRNKENESVHSNLSPNKAGISTIDAVLSQHFDSTLQEISRQ